MSTIIPNFFSINGVIDTSKSVLENMNKIGEAVGCWITYDIHQGKWAVVINASGSSVATFNDTNIIGGINLTSTSLTEVYNSVEITFPNKELTDEPDVIRVSIPTINRYPNEPDNVLSLSTELINNPAQARLLASIQLKQSRIDKVITFSTDYSKIGLKAGDLIAVTNTAYGFSSKVFRIITISEDDTDDGNLIVNITALEYDADVYSTTGLVYDYRSRSSGISSNRNNQYLTASDNAAVTTATANGLSDPTALTALILSLVNNGKLTPTVFRFDAAPVSLAGLPDIGSVSDSFIDWNSSFGPEVNSGYSYTAQYTGRYLATYFFNFGGNNSSVGDAAPSQCRKRVRTRVYINGTAISTMAASTIPKGDDPFNDLTLPVEFTATLGNVINFRYNVKNDWSGAPVVFTSVTLTFLGT
jgi:hypothetical protein